MEQQQLETAPSFTQLIDLASEKLGGKALVCSDDFFAEMENLVKPGRGIFIADKYTDRGKWMDGWESRRKRVSGHDWCILKLGASGKIRGVDIDTNHFLGNHPPHASLEACYMSGDPSIDVLQSDDCPWEEILPKSPLNPGSQHFFEIDDEAIYSHVRLHIYPDGGVARLKVYGEVIRNWDEVNENEEIDLIAATNGGKSILCNDMFFSHMDNLIMPGRGVNMGDGWETKRNRTPNNRDWVIVRLAHPGIVNSALVDTCHFKGNYPDRCSIEGIFVEDEASTDWESPNLPWQNILPEVKLQADHEHPYQSEIQSHGKISHIRLNIFPDGGVSRLRLFGNIVKS
ncbi:MAG: allantoicase [Bacteroidetes bacterium]|nr:MAG: allantoicase [Bacteroidota bacterium]